MTAFSAERYRDSDTGRERWAVLHRPTGVWYFPARYGRLAALRLAARLNRNA